MPADLPLPWPPLPATPSPTTASTAPYHLVLPYAALDGAPPVATPELDALLPLLRLEQRDGADFDSPIPPHERVLAAAWGLPASAPAWAAIHAPLGQPHAWLTPCHLHAGADQVRLDDPAELQLTLDEAQALCALLAPWWAEDGLQLEVLTPLLWRVSGAPLANLRTASLDRAVLRDASQWLPQTQPFQRLHSEAQMLLYSHPFNDAREARRLPPVNGFWLHGAGQLASAVAAPTQTITVVDSLRQAALRQDWRAWQAAWQAADAGPVAQLRAHIRSGHPGRLTLAGEVQAFTFSGAGSALFMRFAGLFNRKTFASLREQL